MSLVSIVAAPTGGLIMDKMGLIIGIYVAITMALFGQVLMTLAAAASSYELMLIGRFTYGMGFEPINTVKNIITAKWFLGGELSFANNVNLACARVFVFANGYSMPWVTLNYGYTQAFLLGSGIMLISWFSSILIVNLQRKFKAYELNSE